MTTWFRCNRITGLQNLAKIAAVSLCLVISSQSIAANSPDETELRKVWGLYTQHQYVQCADAFDALIKTSAPNARLYYHAALANRACNRNARAKQLCQYIATNFRAAPELGYVQKIYPEFAPAPASASAPATAAVAATPDAIGGKSVQELMKTEEGRKALQEAIEKKEAAAAAKVSPMRAKSKGGRPGDPVFTAADIAKDGAGGIDQMYYPNCWFESSMSAMAMLPRGQRLMADMIRYGDKEGTYVVRFPNDGAIYKITEESLEKTGVHDKSLWATLIESAQTQKYPDDAGGQLYEGLASLSGRTAKNLSTSSAAPGELVSFIQAAVKAQDPIICGSQYAYPSGYPRLVVPSHAYTITGFDAGTNMVTIRNPHGANSKRVSLPSDPHHEQFEQLEDGVFKMHINLFKFYFSDVASVAL